MILFDKRCPNFFVFKQLAEFKLWFVVYKLHLLKSYQTIFFRVPRVKGNLEWLQRLTMFGRCADAVVFYVEHWTHVNWNKTNRIVECVEHRRNKSICNVLCFGHHRKFQPQIDDKNNWMQHFLQDELSHILRILFLIKIAKLIWFNLNMMNQTYRNVHVPLAKI